MKSIMKIGILTLIMVCAFNLVSAKTFPVINFENNKTLVVDLQDWTNTDVSIAIRDYNGFVLHKEQILEGSQNLRKYNLMHLPVGHYELLIEGDNKVAIHTLSVKFDEVVAEKINEKMIFKPTVIITNNAIKPATTNIHQLIAVL